MRRDAGVPGGVLGEAGVGAGVGAGDAEDHEGLPVGAEDEGGRGGVEGPASLEPANLRPRLRVHVASERGPIT